MVKSAAEQLLRRSQDAERLGRNQEAAVRKHQAGVLLDQHKDRFINFLPFYNQLHDKSLECHHEAALLRSRADGPPLPPGGLAAPTAVSVSAPAGAPEAEESLVVDLPSETFADVIGIEAAKQSLREAVIQPLRWPQLFGSKAMAAWRGVLLYGPPGTGKTMLARAAAHEAKCTFFALKASHILHPHVGVSERRVRELFEHAERRAPAIIFLDECDALFKERSDRENEVSMRVKTEFFTAMAGFRPTSRILVIAATNLFAGLDKAIVRRFDVRIHVPPPDAAGRARIFASMVAALGSSNCRVDSLGADDFADFAARTEHCTGADIEIILREAIYRARARITEAAYFRYTGPQRVVPAEAGEAGAFAAPEDTSALPVQLELGRAAILQAIACKPPALDAAALQKYERLNAS